MCTALCIVHSRLGWIWMTVSMRSITHSTNIGTLHLDWFGCEIKCELSSKMAHSTNVGSLDFNWVGWVVQYAPVHLDWVVYELQCRCLINAVTWHTVQTLAHCTWIGSDVHPPRSALAYPCICQQSLASPSPSSSFHHYPRLCYHHKFPIVIMCNACTEWVVCGSCLPLFQILAKSYQNFCFNNFQIFPSLRFGNLYQCSTCRCSCIAFASTVDWSLPFWWLKLLLHSCRYS